MSLFEPVVPQRYLAPFHRALERVPKALADRALRVSGLDSAVPDQPDAAVPLQKIEALIDIVIADPAHADLGFNAGLSLALEDHGPLAPILLQAHSLEARLRLQAHYFRLITPIFSWQFELLAEGAELIVRPAAPFRPHGLRTFFELYAAAHAHNVGQVLRDTRHFLRIHMPFAAPDHVARYRALPNVRFRFSPSRLPELKVFYPEEVLAIRLGGARIGTAEKGRLDRLQRRISRTRRIGEWTHFMLSEAEACQPTVDELATMLNTSRRSFERALAAESIRFRDLSKRVRFERACTMLRDPSASVAQVAYRLGYSDPAAFGHAFHAMAGCSPSRYRQVS